MVFLVVMGVCGSGKTTVALEIGKRLNWPVADADDFHTDANKQKMSQSIPLTDEDRYPWLQRIHQHMAREVINGRNGVVTCSALKKKYRQMLLTGCLNTSLEDHNLQQDVMFVYLKGSKQLIEERLARRTGHFMSSKLLQSQLDDLEEPASWEKCIAVDIGQKTSQIVTHVVNNLPI